MNLQSIARRALSGSLLERPPVPTGMKALPRLSGSVPIVGHTVEFVRSAIDLLFRANRELGEIAELEVGGKRMVAVFGPDAHEAVFRASDSHLNPSEAYKIMTPVFGEGMLYDASQDRMNEQLKMFLPALRDRRMRTYGEIILDEVSKSIEDWGDEGVLDVVDYCRTLTNFTSSHCLLGQEFRERMTEEFAVIYHELERGVTPLSYLNAHLPLPAFRARDRARVRLVELIGSIVDERAHSGRTGEDFLQTLMDAKYKSGASLTHDEITGMLLSAMFAGHHTSSVTTAWSLIELCQNPAYQRRVAAELDAIYGAAELPTTYQSLRSMPATENCVKEVLRLHPPLYLLVRVALKDFRFKDYLIPKGTWILLSPTVAHQMGEVFSYPQYFDPDRFAPPRSEDKKDWAFIAFGGGRHKCMGNAFALLQVKAILATILRRYEFELIDSEVKSNYKGLVVSPTEPCRLKYRRREAKTTQVAVPRTEVKQDKTQLTIRLDEDLCQGHAVCVSEAPTVFALNGEGRVKLLTSRPDPSLNASVRAAAAHCPQKVILLSEEKQEDQAARCPF